MLYIGFIGGVLHLELKHFATSGVCEIAYLACPANQLTKTCERFVTKVLYL